MKADLIILDEKIGRFHAKHAELKMTGTVGVIVKAKTKGLITKLRPVLEVLMDKEVWLGTKLMREILKKVRQE